MKKLDEDAPHEVMLTIDASTGQNAISQAKLFHEATVSKYLVAINGKQRARASIRCVKTGGEP
jgi:signal recognition particle GTPase